MGKDVDIFLDKGGCHSPHYTSPRQECAGTFALPHMREEQSKESFYFSDCKCFQLKEPLDVVVLRTQNHYMDLQSGYKAH